MRVSEGCIHDMGEAEAGNQLNRAYARQSTTLAKQSIVGSALQFRKIAEQIVVILCEKIEDRPAAIAITIRN
jgi:hypothetical protein